jgi:hypothetical protein
MINEQGADASSVVKMPQITPIAEEARIFTTAHSELTKSGRLEYPGQVVKAM